MSRPACGRYGVDAAKEAERQPLVVAPHLLTSELPTSIVA